MPWCAGVVWFGWSGLGVQVAEDVSGNNCLDWVSNGAAWCACVCVCVSYSDSSFYLYASEPCDILPLGGLYMRLLPLGDSHLNMVAEQLLQVYNQKLLHRLSAVAMLIFSGFSA